MEVFQSARVSSNHATQVRAEWLNVPSCSCLAKSNRHRAARTSGVLPAHLTYWWCMLVLALLALGLASESTAVVVKSVLQQLHCLLTQLKITRGDSHL